MEFKGSYSQSYTINRELKKLIVKVQLHQHDGLFKPKQSLYYGTATVDDIDYQHEDLVGCVNAKFMAESIGKEVIQARKQEAKEKGQTFRLKKK